MFTVKQLSEIAGVTPRTLHYYDAIGLLLPAQVGTNGYRYYDQDNLMQLQQILLYRELGLPLEKIRVIMNQPDFYIQAALEKHKEELSKRLKHVERMVATVENTLDYLQGKKQMSPKQLFDVFNEEQQAEYEKEAMEKYDPEIVKASNKKWKSYTNEEKQRIGEEGNAVYTDIVAAMPQGAGSAAVQECIERWRKHMDYFWTPSDEQLVLLAQGYTSDARFKANFDKIHPDLAEFMLEAVKIYAANRKNK